MSDDKYTCQLCGIQKPMGEYHDPFKECWQAQLDTERGRVAMLESALEFYADDNNWKTGYLEDPNNGESKWIAYDSQSDGCCYECCGGCNYITSHDTGFKARQALQANASDWLEQQKAAAVAVERERALERAKQALSLFHKEYLARFMSGSNTGEYYGRGQLEGLAIGLWVALNGDLSGIDDKEWNAYIDIWGGDRWKEATNPSIEQEEQ